MKKFMILTIMVAITFVMAQDEVLVMQEESLVEQSKIATTFTYGVKGGVSFNHFLGDFPIDITPKLYTGFTAGVFGNYKINDKFSVQPEILYTRKGSKFKNKYSDIADLYFKTDWIEIPILGMYQINDDFSLFCGPYLGFYLNGQYVIELLSVLY